MRIVPAKLGQDKSESSVECLAEAHSLKGKALPSLLQTLSVRAAGSSAQRYFGAEKRIDTASTDKSGTKVHSGLS